MSNLDRKTAEAIEHVNQAEKCLKTGLLKWKPDHEGASSEYEKAAIAFRNAKALEQAASCYIKCSEERRKNKDMFHAAKALEEAGKLFRDLKNLEKSADLVEEACGLYVEYGSPETGRIALEKVAKMLEMNKPERAIKLFKKACDVAEAQDNNRVAAEMLGSAARNAVKIKKFDEASSALAQQATFLGTFDHHGLLPKVAFYSVLVHIARTDTVAADKALQACMRADEIVAETIEASLAQKLITAYDNSDYDSALEVINHHEVRNMDNDYVILSREIKFPGSSKKGASGSSRGQEASSIPCQEDDDEIDLK